MPWKQPFETTDPETGEVTTAKVKVDENGYVSDFLHGIEQDQEGGKHGHVWGLNQENEESIGGRDPQDASGKSVYSTTEDDENNISELEDFGSETSASVGESIESHAESNESEDSYSELEDFGSETSEGESGWNTYETDSSGENGESFEGGEAGEGE